MQVECKDDVTNFIERNELYPMQNYKGIAEYDILNPNKYDMSQPGMMPFIRFHSHLKTGEFLPLPNEHSLNYRELQWELERWTLFQQLPHIMKVGQNFITTI